MLRTEKTPEIFELGKTKMQVWVNPAHSQKTNPLKERLSNGPDNWDFRLDLDDYANVVATESSYSKSYALLNELQAKLIAAFYALRKGETPIISSRALTRDRYIKDEILKHLNKHDAHFLKKYPVSADKNTIRYFVAMIEATLQTLRVSLSELGSLSFKSRMLHNDNNTYDVL